MSAVVRGKRPLLDMRTHAREQADLCVTYAQDGAYHSAAATARRLADTLQAHADRVSPRPAAQKAAQVPG
jgi:hypothetical protein